MLPFAWLDRFATPLAGATLRGAIILLGALILTTLLRRRSAAARHAIWAGAIAMQLVVLVLGAWGPHWRVATPHVVADAISPLVAVPAAEQLETTPVPRDMSTVAPAAPQRTVTATITSPQLPAPRIAEVTAAPTLPAVRDEPRLHGRDLLLIVWLAGALFVLLRLAAGTAVVAALARRGARVDDGSWLSLTQRLATSLHIDRPLILMRGSRIGVPITWGIIYPIVLLPDDADGWTEERRRFVLVHEMAHVKRLDALTQLVGQLVLAVFWFNPLVWIANRRMQLEREHACDDYVLRHGTAPTMYAEELLAMVRQLGTPEHRSAARRSRPSPRSPWPAARSSRDACSPSSIPSSTATHSTGAAPS
jgi:beta-lactamase regulating signal transducer with metallopeptidase domain